jgi:hypothetical protein
VRYRAVQHPAVIASGIITNILIIISVLSAFPWVRKLVTALKLLSSNSNLFNSTYHNVFEKHHRFIGWLGLAVRNNKKSLVPPLIKLPDDMGLCDHGQHIRHQAW